MLTSRSSSNAKGNVSCHGKVIEKHGRYMRMRRHQEQAARVKIITDVMGDV